MHLSTRRKSVPVLVFAAAIFSAAIAANADIVTMDFLGAQGNNSGGVYVYPYEFSINGSQATDILMCDDFDHEITSGETWDASTTAVSDLNDINVGTLQYPGAGLQGYLEAADLFTEEVTAYNASNSDPAGLYNWAVWDLLSNTDVSASKLTSDQETQVQIYLTAAEDAGPTLDSSDFPDITIYTPTDMSADGPQEFMGYSTGNTTVPEPVTLALLPILGMTVLSRRRR